MKLSIDFYNRNIYRALGVQISEIPYGFRQSLGFPFLFKWPKDVKNAQSQIDYSAKVYNWIVNHADKDLLQDYCESIKAGGSKSLSLSGKLKKIFNNFLDKNKGVELKPNLFNLSQNTFFV